MKLINQTVNEVLPDPVWPNHKRSKPSNTTPKNQNDIQEEKATIRNRKVRKTEIKVRPGRKRNHFLFVAGNR